MKRIKKYIFSTILIASATLMWGCGGRTEKWAYSHEPDKEIIALSDDGKVTYKGNEYTYTRDDNFLKLKDKDGQELDLRYELNGDNMTLYEESVYTREGVGESGSIVGVWVQNNGWSYQFTEDGKFSEENIFFGHYSVDDANSCIRLMYDDPIEDAYLYYSLDGDKLTVAYPWPMVRVQ